MATYNLTLAQLDAVTPAIPASLRAPGSGVAFAYAEGSTTAGVLTTTASADALVAPIVAAVLAGHTPAAPQADLQAYASAKQAAIAGGGVSVNVAASGATPLMLEAATDALGRVDLAGLLQMSSLSPAATFGWDQNNETIPLTASQVQALALGVGAFVQLTFTVLGAVRAAIAAGTITTTAQIDNPTTVGLSAWPVNS